MRLDEQDSCLLERAARVLEILDYLYRRHLSNRGLTNRTGLSDRQGCAKRVRGMSSVELAKMLLGSPHSRQRIPPDPLSFHEQLSPPPGL